MNNQPRVGQHRRRKRLAVVVFVVCAAIVLCGVLLRTWNLQLNAEEHRLVGRWSFQTDITSEPIQSFEFRYDRIVVQGGPKGYIATYDWRISDGRLVLTQYVHRSVNKPVTYEVYRVLNGTIRGTAENDEPTPFQLDWKGANRVHLKSPDTGAVIVTLERELPLRGIRKPK